MATEPQGPGWWIASDGNHYPPDQHPDPEHRARFAGPPAAPPAPSPVDAPPAGPPQVDPRATISVPLGQTFGTPGSDAPGPSIGAPDWQSPQAGPPGYDAPPPGAGSPPPFPDAAATPPLPGTYAAPPAYAGAPAYAAAAPTPFGGQGGYPAVLTVDRAERIARWRVFLHGFMLFPHVIVWYLLNAIGGIVVVLSWFVILFTGKLPRGFHDFSSMVIRYGNRIVGYALFMTEEYPPFEFDSSAGDLTAYPVRTDIAYVEEHNRLTSFFRYFMVLPHAFVLAFVFVGAYVMVLIGWWAVLITGRLPQGIANYLIGTGRWVTRVSAYYNLLTDEYPPFSMS